ncbi:MAG: hypothetical protein JXR95_13245 [Deltaproteobacteria bacterium]|nr:hypothetical protein [Deltaproteobacteria bacterium]
MGPLKKFSCEQRKAKKQLPCVRNLKLERILISEPPQFTVVILKHSTLGTIQMKLWGRNPTVCEFMGENKYSVETFFKDKCPSDKLRIQKS